MQARRLRCVAFTLVEVEKREYMRREPVFIALTVLLLFFPAVVAARAITVITTSEESPEATLAEIMEELYGWDNIIRISDYNAEPGDPIDQFWTYLEKDQEGKKDQQGTAEAKAKFAGYEHQFGFLPSGDEATFYDIFSSGGATQDIYDGYGGSDGTQKGFLDSSQTGDIFRFALNVMPNCGPDYVLSSAPNDNAGGIDQMVTYQITGNDGHCDNVIGNYVIAWEDLRYHSSSFDGDYNDLVVEVSGVVPYNIPEPAALVLLGLGGFVLFLRPGRKTV